MSVVEKVLVSFLLLLALGFILLGGLALAADPIVERSLIITYIGPEGDVEFDMHWTRKNMEDFPSIYCDGQFEFQTIVKERGDLEIVCMWREE